MATTSFTIPTYRLKDAHESVQAYRESFQSHGHDVPIIVFDDSPQDIHDRDFPAFAARVGKNVWYVGPQEKARFIDHMVRKVGDEGTIRRILRPSYGGNRNFTALYTTGDFFISADDDMRPHGLHAAESGILSEGEVLKGRYMDKRTLDGQVRRQEYDLLAAYLDVLGKRVRDVSGYCLGTTLVDSMTDLYTNKTVTGLVPNTVSVVGKEVNPDAKIITAQTFRSGSADVDAVDYVHDFLVNPHLAFINDMMMRYVIERFQPCVTATNWRLDNGISGYDNRDGIPPFIPTKLRFEDYFLRVWLQDPSVAAAHINAAQTHYRNPYMRQSLAHDLWNEDMANFIKPRLKEMVRFDGGNATLEGRIHVARAESDAILAKGKEYYDRAITRAAEVIARQERDNGFSPEQKSQWISGFAKDIFEEFAGFDGEAFYARMQQTADEEIEALAEALRVWPSLQDVARDMKAKNELPIRRVR